MNCQYCSNACQFVELDDVNSKTIEVWKCTNCPAVVRYSKFVDSDYISMVCIQLKMNGKRYAVHLLSERLHTNEMDHASEIVEVIPTLYSGEQIGFNVKRIAFFTGHINITPTNIAEKLPIYITFS